MDTTHTLKQDCEKVQALINMVHMVDHVKRDYDIEVLYHEIESLNMLAMEAQRCMDALSDKVEQLENADNFGNAMNALNGVTTK